MRLQGKLAVQIGACLVFALLLICALYQINARTPRIHVSELALLDALPEDGPVILTGGRYETDARGRSEYVLRFHWERADFIHLPRTVSLTLNGESDVPREAFRGLLFQLDPDEINGGDFELRLTSDRQMLMLVDCNIYLGSLEQITSFIGSSTEVNSYIKGLCFAVMLLSLVLLLFKPSERYLLWLALLCFFRADYTRLQTVFSWLAVLIPGLSLLNEAAVYLVLFELLTALLQGKLMESFVPVRIGKLPFPWYAAAAAVPVVLLYKEPRLSAFASLVFFAVLYLCYLVCFLRLSPSLVGERNLLLVSWVLTVVLRFFDEFCELGWVPSGDVNLRFRLRGLVSMIFVIAFFVLVGKVFAQKFQEADELNLTLEEKIRQKTRQQTLFVRSMLHNLKTPLFSLSGYSDMALRAVDRDPRQAKQYMEKAREKAIFAGELMDHIFLVTQMDADMVRFQSAPVNLGELLKTVAETPTAGQEGKTLHLSLELPEEIYLQGDQLYLRQAFQNILDNARINTPEGGSITVRAEKTGENLTVLFRDTGCGVAPEEREKIFDAYYSNRHGKQPSSGLGLYITAEIIRRHGGSVRVESKEGEGADFIVQLPLSPDPPSKM